MEHLEQRRLLAVDFFGWQNVVTPADVNGDGVVAPADALLVVHELYTTGARRLGAPAVSAASAGGAEGEGSGRAFIDVNGDGYLSPADAFMVVAELRAEGQTDLAQFRLETTDLAGTPVSAIVQGDQFVLNVFIDDLRGPPGTVPDPRGVFQAYVDVTFDSSLVTAIGPLSFGPWYQEQTSGSLLTPGLVDEAGGTQTGLGFPINDPDDPLTPFAGGPVGPDELLLFSVPFEATNAGTVTFAGDPADLPLFHDLTLFEPPSAVPTDDIVYGTATLTVHAAPVIAFPDEFTVDEDSSNNSFSVLDNDQISSGGTLVITGVGATDRGGNVVNNGDHLLYTPASDFFGTDTFTYDIGDGLGNVDQETVVVTVIDVNDAPVARNDRGAGYTTDGDTVLTTGNVLDNDTDLEGDGLFVSRLSTTGTLGRVTNNGDGTFNYDPNGQFDHLVFGQQATDRFTYTVADGNGGFDTARVTITVTGVPPAAHQVTGFVYADVDNDGQKDAVERAIGGVEVRLRGTDVFGSRISLSTLTDAQGRYSFAAAYPGDYELIEVQPKFFLDGIDTLNGVAHTGTNDRVAITPDMDLASLDVRFGERSLHPNFIDVADSTNLPLREGIVVGFDAQWNLLWYSVLDGWDDVTSVSVSMSRGGRTATLKVSEGQAGDLTFNVPTAPSAGWFRVKGETSQGRVVQFMGTKADFQR